jgi:hypothetical protein
MTTQQTAEYYSHLAVRTGSNAISRMLDGNVSEANELATNAAKFAFAAYPSLRS